MTKFNNIYKIIVRIGERVLWPIIAVACFVLSTIGFIFSAIFIERSQVRTPIYITYPAGYTDVAGQNDNSSDSKSKPSTTLTKSSKTFKKSKKSIKTVTSTNS